MCYPYQYLAKTLKYKTQDSQNTPSHSYVHPVTMDVLAADSRNLGQSKV